MQIQDLQREFKYNSVKLPDPNPQFTLVQVRDFFSTVYPEIISADIEGPEVIGNRNVYSFRRAVGTKGGRSFEGMISDLAALVQINWLDDSDADLIHDMQERIDGISVRLVSIDEFLSVMALHRKYCDKETAGAAV